MEKERGVDWQWRAQVIASVQPWPRSRDFLNLRRVPMHRSVMASLVHNWFYQLRHLVERELLELLMFGKLVEGLHLPLGDSGLSSWLLKMLAPQLVRNSLQVFLYIR